MLEVTIRDFQPVPYTLTHVLVDYYIEFETLFFQVITILRGALC